MIDLLLLGLGVEMQVDFSLHHHQLPRVVVNALCEDAQAFFLLLEHLEHVFEVFVGDGVFFAWRLAVVLDQRVLGGLLWGIFIALFGFKGAHAAQLGIDVGYGGKHALILSSDWVANLLEQLPLIVNQHIALLSVVGVGPALVVHKFLVLREYTNHSFLDDFVLLLGNVQTLLHIDFLLLVDSFHVLHDGFQAVADLVKRAERVAILVTAASNYLLASLQ